MLIEEEITLFIENKESNGALLITGKWGCGKSYLIKKCVNDLNTQKNAIAVISLFGIDNVVTLNAKVRDAYLEFTSGIFGKKAQKLYGTLKKVATDSANITAAALPESAAASAVSMGVSSVLSFNPLNFINVKNTVGQGEKQRKFVLVFDDFERCNIDRRDLFGVINEYSENKEIKVIIVADETKIKDDAYKEFKEKVVVRTLRMSSNYPEIIESIIKKYKTTNDEYKQFLVKSKDCIIGAFTHSGYDNLRTLKSCLMDFERIFKVLRKSGIPLKNIESMFYKFCVITYETKTGNYSIGPYGMYTIVTNEVDPKKRDNAVNVIKSKYSEGAFENIPNSISRWVVSGEWDADVFQNELKREYLSDEVSPEERFLICGFWDLEQSDIDQGMPVLVERAKRGEASRDELIALLQKTHMLKKYNIPLPCDVDYQVITKGFDERCENVKKGIVEEPRKRTFTQDSEIDEEAIPLKIKIEKMGDRIYAWENRKSFVSYLNGDGNVSPYHLNNICIETFDDELYRLFKDKYLSSNNEERVELCRVLLRIDFNNQYYSTPVDIEITLKNYGSLISVLRKLSEKMVLQSIPL